MVQSSTSSDKKKKKRKSKRASTTPPENKVKPQVVSLPPETSPLLPQLSPDQPRGQLPKLRATSKRDGQWLAGSSSRRSEKHRNDSPSLLTVIHKASGSGDPVQEYVDRLSTQDRESLRWEGVLEDPQAEEKRLDPYRANRRQRYISHRAALLKATERDLS